MLINTLVLEDSPTQLRIISAMVAQAGGKVFEALDAQAAFKVLLSQRIDLILMDVFLREEDSLRHTDGFRRAAPGAQIAVMTAGSRGERAISTEKALAAARQAKVDFLLAKPFTPRQIGDVLQQVEASMRHRRYDGRILVVEDSATVRTLIVKALKQDGHQVHEARTMEEAFGRIDVLRVELVIADIFLPGMGGLRGITRIRKAWPDVQILAISAGLESKWDAATILDQARTAGADAALQKPFPAGELQHVVAQMLRTGTTGSVAALPSTELEDVVEL